MFSVAIFHGYELRGSGSNEYTRYLARALARAGHDVAVLCREPRAGDWEAAARVVVWDREGRGRELRRRAVASGGAITVHRLPHGEVRPVYVTDKQRPGRVKAFVELSDAELAAYHEREVRVVTAVLREQPVALLHANHLIWQPVAAAEACRATGTPFVVFPHGSSIEYTVREDVRYRERAGDALEAARGLITGNREVLARILDLYPDRRETLLGKSAIVGVGVDTSLFRPLARTGRGQALATLSASGPFGGKRPEQSAELRRRVDRGDTTAVHEYWEAYDHSAPDADLDVKLGALDEDGPLLLYVGALTAGKGVQSLIAAFPRILESHPRARLLIVGSGTYREALEALVHAVASRNRALLEALVDRGWALDRGGPARPWEDVRHALRDDASSSALYRNGPLLAERIVFTGRLEHERLRFLFPCADLAVFPSLVPEAYPLVLMESLANGVLPAVTDFSGFRDALAELDGLLGSDLVARLRLPAEPERRVERIAERCAAALAEAGDPALRERLRAIAVERYDWSVRGRQMLAAYRKFL